MLLVTRTENSSKGNRPVSLGRYDSDLTENPDRSLYSVPATDVLGFTLARKGIVARCICYAFSTYFLVGQGGNDGWIPLGDRTGCRYYHSIEHELINLAIQQPVGELECLNAVVLFAMHSWCNPLAFRPALLNERDNYRDLLRLRLSGETVVGVAVASALSSVIEGLPV